MYKAVWAAGILYELYYKISMTEEELHTVSSYFIMSLKRIRQKKRFVIASDGGIGTARALELSELLLKLSPALCIADICSFYQLSWGHPSGYDAVISCKEPGNLQKPCLCVKPTPDRADAEDIEAFLSSWKRDALRECMVCLPRCNTQTVEMAPRGSAQLMRDINEHLASMNAGGSPCARIGLDNGLVIGERCGCASLWRKGSAEPCSSGSSSRWPRGRLVGAGSARGHHPLRRGGRSTSPLRASSWTINIILTVDVYREGYRCCRRNGIRPASGDKGSGAAGREARGGDDTAHEIARLTGRRRRPRSSSRP